MNVTVIVTVTLFISADLYYLHSIPFFGGPQRFETFHAALAGGVCASNRGAYQDLTSGNRLGWAGSFDSPTVLVSKSVKVTRLQMADAKPVGN